MLDHIIIHERRAGRKLAAVVLVAFGVSVSWLLLWLMRDRPFALAHPLLFLGGPGSLGLGLWMLSRDGRAKPRLAIGADAFTILPDGRGQRAATIPWLDLTSVTQTGLSHRDARLRFATTTGDYELATRFLDRSPDDILRLITMQLENRGRHLAQTTSPVLGAPTGIWKVRDGVPFQPD